MLLSWLFCLRFKETKGLNTGHKKHHCHLSLGCKIAKAMFFPVSYMTHCLSQLKSCMTDHMEYSVSRYRGADWSKIVLKLVKYCHLFLKELCQHGTTWFSESYFSVIKVHFLTVSTCERLVENCTSCKYIVHDFCELAWRLKFLENWWLVEFA